MHGASPRTSGAWHLSLLLAFAGAGILPLFLHPPSSWRQPVCPLATVASGPGVILDYAAWYPFSFLVVMSERHPFLGKIVTGRVHSGSVAVGDRLKVLWRDGE